MADVSRKLSTNIFSKLINLKIINVLEKRQ